MNMSDDITKLAAALVKAQSEMEGAKKDAANPHFKSKYATLEAVVDAVKGPLNRNGIAYVQMPSEVVDSGIEIDTMLIHESGQWLRSVLHVPLGKRDAQGVGSAISYGRRYALMSVCGIPAEDDDGNAASEKHKVNAGDADHVSKLVVKVNSLDELNELWRTELVQSVVHQAPKAIAERVRAAFSERKAALSQQEAA